MSKIKDKSIDELNLEQAIIGVLMDFDEEFPDSRGVFENNDPYGSRRGAIKDWLFWRIKKLFKEEL
jgi:hypothetical protein